MDKIAAWICLSFLAGVMIAHAQYQPIFNELGRVEEEIEAYRQSAVIGWVRMDCVTKELYFVGVGNWGNYLKR